MLRYPITIFFSAFLLFQVQPLIGKVILPWFGGSPAVWTACMLFFQVLLLGGYSYAHLVTTRLSARSLAALHAVLLLVSLAFLPISPDPSWKPAAGDPPVLRILGLLVMTMGLPYFLLSTTGPLLQDSFRRETGRTPYRLYALSNIGSLLALLSYPFVFEPQFSLRIQIVVWSAGYVLFVALGLWSAVAFARVWGTTDETPAANPAEADAPRPPLGHIALWLALAACGSVMLLATTNQLCQEVTSVPFLWVLPLSLYLFTFIICFDHERWYLPRTFAVLLAGAVILACYAMFEGNDLKLWKQLVAYSCALFVCCMVCHGELVRFKPAPKYATLFYLMVAAGGSLGGVLVAIVAPMVLNGYWEYPIGLLATIVLAMVANMVRTERQVAVPRPVMIGGIALAIALSLAVGLVLGRAGQEVTVQGTLERARNFYGALRVDLEPYPHSDNGPMHELVHGSIQHGFQFIDPSKRNLPTSYYGAPSGLGLAINHHPRRNAEKPEDQTLRIGVVGLGTGTVAAHGRAGDSIQFYEINPEIVRLSDKYFTYRQDTPAEVEVVMGDARLTMEREAARKDAPKFDVLAIDAFSSDAIPMHLLTKEAVALYLERLKPDGLLCIHTSNRFLDLAGVVLGLAREFGYGCVVIESPQDLAAGLNPATWIIVTRNWKFLADPAVVEMSKPSWPESDEIPIWTDDYGSLWDVLRQ